MSTGVEKKYDMMGVFEGGTHEASWREGGGYG
jgi:hypothetical protein